MSNTSVTRLPVSSRLESRRLNLGNTIGGFLGDVGSTIGSALNLGRLKGSYNYSGELDGDDSDFFGFDLGRNGSTKLSLVNLLGASLLGGGLISAVLLNASGNVVRELISTNVSPGERDGFSLSGLDSGRYYVKLNSLDDQAVKYRLKLNNSFSSLTDLGTTAIGDLRKLYRSTSSTTKDNAQLYSFKLGQTGKLKVTLRNRLKSDFFGGFLRDRDVTATLLDANKTVLEDYTLNASPGKLKGLTIQNLEGGNYFVNVKTKQRSRVPFTLNLAPSFSS